MVSNQVSIVILTKNEAEYIGRCVRSVCWADEVLVIDSGSTDGTREIAASLGATVYEQEWLGYSGQRNRGIELAKHDWIMMIDADEIVTPELRDSILKVLHGTMNPQDGYYVDRRGDFLGILLPNIQRPSRVRGFVRLFHRKHSGFDPETLVHEVVLVPGQHLPLPGVLLHWRGFTMEEYIPQFNRYATLEAQQLDKEGKTATAFTIFFRPILRFLWLYIYKREFRLGTQGLIHAMLKASNEFMRYAKLWEMHNVPRTIQPPSHLYREPEIPPPAPTETKDQAPA